MPAAVQRKAIEASRQRFTLRVTCRIVPFMFSMMLVQARERRRSWGRRSRTTHRISSSLSRMVAEIPGQSFSSRRARLRTSCSALTASSSSQACRRVLRTAACSDFGNRSVMLRALCTWQRWIGVSWPNVRRIALDSALAPSMMNSQTPAGSRPRSTRLSSRASTVAAFSVAPSTKPSGCFSPRPSMPTAATRINSSPTCIDLDRQQIERRQVGGQQFPHLRARQRDELARHRRLRGAVARDRPDIAVRQAHRAAELPGRDVDQHLVHRPLVEQGLVLGRSPTRQHQFLFALTAANPGAINPDPASVKADLALGLTPPPAPPPVMPLMAVAADHGRFFLQKLLKRLDPSDQAELVKAALNFLESHGHGRPFVRHRGCIQGYRGSRCSHIFLHGVAPLREWNTPSLPAQGEQRPPPICNIDRDIPLDRPPGVK